MAAFSVWPRSTCIAGLPLPIFRTSMTSRAGRAPGLSQATSTWTWGSRATSARSRSLPLWRVGRAPGT
eukprot:12851082-Alexandrium_andersonii.AAC.1